MSGTPLKVIRSAKLESDRLSEQHLPYTVAPPHQDYLAAENASLRLLIAEAEMNSQTMLARQASTPASARHPINCRS